MPSKVTTLSRPIVERIILRKIIHDACFELINNKKMADELYMYIIKPVEDYLDDCEKKDISFNI